VRNQTGARLVEEAKHTHLAKVTEAGCFQAIMRHATSAYYRIIVAGDSTRILTRSYATDKLVSQQYKSIEIN